jgi:hypothetical protein
LTLKVAIRYALSKGIGACAALRDWEFPRHRRTGDDAKTMNSEASRLIPKKRSISVAHWRQIVTLAHALLLGVVVAGCATVGTPPVTKDSPEGVKAEVVGKRAQARWDALIAGNLKDAYAFLSPASRSTTSLAQYEQRHRIGFYRGIRVDSVRCEGEVCTAKLHPTYDTKAIKGMATRITEKWVIEDGKAWFVEQS